MIDPLRASAIDCAMTAWPLGGGAHGVFELFVRIADVTQLSGCDVPPILSSASVWSPIPYPEEIGREEALYRRT
ncbi:hypothetical protein, partial [Xanthomonas campestris]|uniref:hypothetical protein n=1 Tax=Xanthomonas campestris TaxID=339 RepID=UPI002167E4D1